MLSLTIASTRPWVEQLDAWAKSSTDWTFAPASLGDLGPVAGRATARSSCPSRSASDVMSSVPFA